MTQPAWKELANDFDWPCTGIVIVDHGSRREDSNRRHEAFVKGWRARGRYCVVEPAHMELAEPSIPTAFDTCVAAGATTIVIICHENHVRSSSRSGPISAAHNRAGPLPTSSARGRQFGAVDGLTPVIRHRGGDWRLSRVLGHEFEREVRIDWSNWCRISSSYNALRCSDMTGWSAGSQGVSGGSPVNTGAADERDAR